LVESDCDPPDDRALMEIARRVGLSPELEAPEPIA
jgi:hypothetical protein